MINAIATAASGNEQAIAGQRILVAPIPIVAKTNGTPIQTAAVIHALTQASCQRELMSAMGGNLPFRHRH